jgi:hypothetical protein
MTSLYNILIFIEGLMMKEKVSSKIIQKVIIKAYLVEKYYKK